MQASLRSRGRPSPVGPWALAVALAALACSSASDDSASACTSEVDASCPPPPCAGRFCGVDEQGNSCGSCDDGKVCTPEGRCACPDPRFGGPGCSSCASQLHAAPACDRCTTAEELAAQERPESATLDVSEVTVASYGDCVNAGVCTLPRTDGACNWGKADRADHPINCVTWYQAEAYCVWRGARLPTQGEWTWFATNGHATTQPWGDAPVSCDVAILDDGGAGCGRNGTWPVCSRPAGNTRGGHCDLVGSVWEWTASGSDTSGQYPDCGFDRAYLGGSWFMDAARVGAEARHEDAPLISLYHLGFRCIQD